MSVSCPVPSHYNLLPTLLPQQKTESRLFAYLISLWFTIPLIGFTLYGGPISDYYFYFSIPMVLFVITYIQQQFLLSRLKIDALIILPILWIVFIYFNTKNHWIKPTEGGLKAQKLEVRKLMSEKNH